MWTFFFPDTTRERKSEFLTQRSVYKTASHKTDHEKHVSALPPPKRKQQKVKADQISTVW